MTRFAAQAGDVVIATDLHKRYILGNRSAEDLAALHVVARRPGTPEHFCLGRPTEFERPSVDRRSVGNELFFETQRHTLIHADPLIVAALLLRLEGERQRIDAVSLAGRRRTVGKHMPKMRFTPSASDFHAVHAE